MTLIGEQMFIPAADDGRITKAEVLAELETMKGYGKPSVTTEKAFWQAGERFRDVFDADAKAVYDDFLTGRLQKLDRKGPGLWDSFRAALGFARDSDEDGLSDIQEMRRGTNRFVADTDHDGWSDGREVERGSDPGRAY